MSAIEKLELLLRSGGSFEMGVCEQVGGLMLLKTPTMQYLADTIEECVETAFDETFGKEVSS